MPRISIRIVLILLASLCNVLIADVETVQGLIARPFSSSNADLPKLKEFGFIRVLVSYNKTNYFLRGGEPKGFEYETLKKYEEFINKGRTSTEKRIRLVFIPVSFDQLLPLLESGLGDIAAAGLTITPERLKSVSFADPYLKNVNEILVSSRDSERIDNLENLSGRTVHVSADSSYHQHLDTINTRFRSIGKPEINIESLAHNLETEDYLELVASGIINYTVADSYMVELWQNVHSGIVPLERIKINQGGRIAWAVRKNNPLLRESLSAFTQQIKKGTLLGNIFFKRYYEKTNWIVNPLAGTERAKLDQYINWFKKYADQYDFDWLQLGAQGFQESKLYQNLRSAAGAVGIMQLLPSTARELGLDPYSAEQNIQAGAKYMRSLLDRMHFDEEVPPARKFDFALAAYNAGPGNVRKWRRAAPESGFDPNIWFGQVEHLAFTETKRYVANVNKYYLAYRLAYEYETEKRMIHDELSK